MEARDLSIQDFRDKPETRVMIASLKAGGTGLDLSMANKCILVDLWWNEALQEQVSRALSSGTFLICLPQAFHLLFISFLQDSQRKGFIY